MLKKIIFIFIVLASIQNAATQEIYSRAFGNPSAIPVVFLHGGPGYNSASFEVTTAQALADKGFYVIVYDRRGEGRSTDPNAKFTLAETYDDLNALLQKYNIKSANFIGHSFGGIVATLYAGQFVQQVKSIELVSAPVALQETFKTILRSCRKIYTDKNDATNLNYIDMIEKMDPTSIEYFAYSFGHAMLNGFYTPKNMTEQAKAIYAAAKQNPAFANASKMTNEPPAGFLKNENYTSIDLTNPLKKLVANKTKIYGLYGKEDGLYSAEQVAQLQQIIGSNNLNYWDNCSHSVFIDQQSMFLDFFKATVK